MKRNFKMAEQIKSVIKLLRNQQMALTTPPVALSFIWAPNSSVTGDNGTCWWALFYGPMKWKAIRYSPISLDKEPMVAFLAATKSFFNVELETDWLASLGRKACPPWDSDIFSICNEDVAIWKIARFTRSTHGTKLFLWSNILMTRNEPFHGPLLDRVQSTCTCRWCHSILHFKSCKMRPSTP